MAPASLPVSAGLLHPLPCFSPEAPRHLNSCPAGGLASPASEPPVTERATRRCERMSALLQDQVLLLETQRGAAGRTLPGQRAWERRCHAQC